MNLPFFIYEFITYFVVLLLTPFTKLFGLRRRKICPRITNPLLYYSAKQLSQLIRTRQVSCEEVMKVYISRVQEVNVMLNAVVEDRFDLALLEAKEIDVYLKSTLKTEDELQRDTPLLGIPFTVKESLAVKGLINNCGVVCADMVKASEDAEIVRLCRKAGAIPILVSNTPEWCLFWETSNNVTGRTSNPYDCRRTPGGSSGGEGALLGSGASLIGLGSDTCGSLRLPAMFTGVFAHRPSPGATSMLGHNPCGYCPNWYNFSSTGAMTRYAEDLPLVLSIIVKPEKRNDLKLNENVQLRNIKFYYLEEERNSWFSHTENKEMKQALDRFIAYLHERYNIETKPVTIKNLYLSYFLCPPLLATMEDKYSQFYDASKNKIVFWQQIYKVFTFKSKMSLCVVFYGILKYICAFTHKKLDQIINIVSRMKKDFQEILQEDGVIFYTSYSNAAHYHNHFFFNPSATRFLTMINILGFPATNSPMGYNSQGLPIGIQVISNINNDRLSVAVAQEMEKFYGGWKPPCRVVPKKHQYFYQ